MQIELYNMVAENVMSPRVRTVRLSDRVKDALERMLELGVSALPVVDAANRCKGLFTKTDILRLTDIAQKFGPHAESADLAALYFGVGIEEVTDVFVEDAMSDSVITVHTTDSIDAVADRMLLHEVHHVPVCDDNDQVVGMVSSMDLVKAISDGATRATNAAAKA